MLVFGSFRDVGKNLLSVISLSAVLSSFGCGDAIVKAPRLVGELTVDPQRIAADGRSSAEVSIRVFRADSNRAPVQGTTIVLVSSRNESGAPVDQIEQPALPTDADGRAVAFLRSSTVGEAEISATVGGRPLCATYEGGQCTALKQTVTFFAGCPDGQIDCGGSCTNTRNDPNHCGACGRVCTLEHASAACQNSNCGVGSCNSGWGDCNAEAGDGCETDLSADVKHCGSCEIPCGLLEVCQGSKCIIPCQDQDNDGFDDRACGGDDCNDTESSIHPGAIELCDKLDNDCDNVIDNLPAANMACADRDPCTDDRCENGACAHSNQVGPCDDQDACTMNDACAGGICTGAPLDADGDGYVPVTCAGFDCDDGNAEVSPGMFEAGAIACADTLDNDCDGFTDNADSSCAPCGGDDDCIDLNQCNGRESCSGTECQAGIPLNCGDGNVCTNDTCNPATGCVNTQNAGPCDDANACTIGDVCAAGACQPGTPRNCDDLNTCTDDGCDPLTGCTHQNNTATCDDGNPCTSGDTCSAGACVPGAASNCDDGNPCTDDSCEPASGCRNVENTDPCDDGSACTTDDACSLSVCTGTPVDCNDGNACTDDPCEPGSGCQHPDNASPCEDGDACTANDQCSGGACVGGPATNCDDSNPCTDDSCLPATGCQHPNNTLPCSDGNACTDGDACSDGACVPGAATNCDDGNACTDDSCDFARGCVNADNTAACEDGSPCSTADACNGGVCVAGPTTKDGDSDGYLDRACPGGNDCNDADGLVNPGATEGPFGTPICSDGEDNNCNTLVDSADPGCKLCTVPADCDDSNPCTTDTCAAPTCQNIPIGDGGACGAPSCSGLDWMERVCLAGICTARLVQSCDDTVACTTDSCDPALGCENIPMNVDPNSAVTATSACLTLGASGLSTVIVDLRNASGGPQSGAALSFNVSGQPLTWVEASVVESPALPGMYYRTLQAPAAGASSTISVSASVCGQPAVALTQTVTINYASAVTGTGGTGGCSPADGNLRVLVVAAESGAPIANAHVLVGLAEGTPFQTSVEDFIQSRPATGTNVALTDAAGYAVFRDLGASLDVPLTVTAGQPDTAAADRAYFTFDRVQAADLVIPLKLSLPADPTVRFTNGVATSASITGGTNDLQGGLVLPQVNLAQLSSLSMERIAAPNRCVSVPLMGAMAVPENLYIPRQTVFIITISEAPWSFSFARNHRLNMIFCSIPINVVQSSCEFSEVIAAFDVRPAVLGEIGFAPSTATGADTTGYAISLDFPYPRTLTITASGKPAKTDLLGLVLGDYSGFDGSGVSYMNGLKLARFNPVGTNDTAAVSFASDGSNNVPTNPDPGNARYFAAAVALFVDPATGRAVANRPAATSENGTSVVFWRADASGTAPFSGAADASWAASGFLGISKVKVAAGNKLFVWDDVRANAITPHLSLHELYRVTSTFRNAALGCALERDVISTSKNLYWEVWRPFDVTCNDTTGGEVTPSPKECFTLPTLPASWPRAGVNPSTGKDDGFAPRQGSGKNCLVNGDCTISGDTCYLFGRRCNEQRHKSCTVNSTCGDCRTGDTCTAEQRICVADVGGSTITQAYEWDFSVGFLDPRGGPAFNFNRFGLGEWLAGLTRVSTNRYEY